MTLRFGQSLLALCTILSALGPVSAFAGECKVKEPTLEAIADAIKIGVVLDVQMAIVAADYYKKTGKQLKVALIARAGQNMKDILTLRDTDAQGRYQTAQQMTINAEYEVPMNEAGGRDVEKVKQYIRKTYGDKRHQSVYSHIGMVFWNHPDGVTPDGKRQWYFRHMLRPCVTGDEVKTGINPNLPQLFDEGILRFFADDPYELRAQILVPTDDIQENLEKLALPKTVVIDGKEYEDNRLPQIFKGEFYNAAAAWNNKVEANSNQYILELVAAASQPYGRVTTRAEAQDVLAKTGFRPMRAMLSGTQAMASLPFAGKLAPYVRVHYEEQPAYANYAIADLITTNAVEDYMKRNNWIMFDRSIYVSDKTVAQKKEQTNAAQGGQ
ncbi:hypothetical protein BH10BDE1_BH10BDE1_18010 [soil metagenome]